MDDLVADFVIECLESLSELDQAVVRLEDMPDDPQTLSLIFRLFHTVKGTCGFLGLPRLEKVAHAAETVLGKLRTRALKIDAAGISLILTAIDRIRLIVDTLGHTGEEPAGDDAPLITALHHLATGQVGLVPGVEDRLDAHAPLFDGYSRNQTVRTDVEVLDTLTTLVSELVLARNQLLQILRSSDRPLTGGEGAQSRLAAPLQLLSQITSDLHESVMRTRMQPIGVAWSALPRLARDLGRELGKDLTLVASGGQTELDRQVLELIKDPLTHMIRNCADHGLEPAAERVARGKPRRGTIMLAAHHENGHVVIEVSDDGRGLDTARIAARAIADGSISEAALARMSEPDIQRFVFHPGFSTAAAVTAISGRGVGLDVVKTNIERLGGSIDFASSPGRGSKFQIRIPLTLAIVRALIVGAAGERFAIAEANVVELVLPGKQPDVTLESIDGVQVLRLRDQLLPLVSTQSLLQLDTTTRTAEPLVIVVTVHDQRFGLAVEQVFDTEELVIRPVAALIKHIPVFSGNAILGDGSVVMVLDAGGIVRQSRLGAETRRDMGRRPDRPSQAPPGDCDLLLIRAGAGVRKALPLARIERLEMIPRALLEVAGSGLITPYRGGLMKLVALDTHIALDTDLQPVLVVGGEGGRPVGLMVDEILDIVHAAVDVAFAAGRPGQPGTAIIDARATEIVDVDVCLGRSARTIGAAAPLEDCAVFDTRQTSFLSSLEAAPAHPRGCSMAVC